MLDQILAFAAKAHEGQVRKYAEEPYIRHPMRVMETCRRYDDSGPVLAAALLHDVLEDTEVTTDQVRQFLVGEMNERDAAATMAHVVALTDVFIKKDYPQWSRRVRKSKELERLKGIAPKAQTIKYADILDNAASVALADPDFTAVLLREYRQQLQHLDKGNPTLRSLALESITARLRELKVPESGEKSKRLGN